MAGKTQMPETPLNNFISQVKAVEMGREIAADGDLLTAYLQTRDDAAFAALVHRHAAMVWGVCRRILRHQQDAEDAFQATFLVLVHKAAGVADRVAVGNWLYGVAHQTAVRVRANTMKTNRRERQGATVLDPPAPERTDDSDLRDIVDDEVVSLPDKYRAVVVLCDLEERPRSEVARRLGVPEGTVAGRLARARAMLAKRFARRGLALPGGVVTALVLEGGVTASAPAAVVASTVKVASVVAAGQVLAGIPPGVVSARAVSIANATLTAMRLTRVKAVALVVAIGFVCGTLGFSAYRSLDGGAKSSSPLVVADDAGKANASDVGRADKPVPNTNVTPKVDDVKRKDKDDKPKRRKDEDDEDDKPKRMNDKPKRMNDMNDKPK
jgi:RNA polymerase sigma factor (sigma-70 family)